MSAQPMKTDSWKPFSALFKILALTMAISLDAPLVDAQTSPNGVIGGKIQKRASGVLALMGYTLTPDVTTGSISISNGETGNPEITMISLGGGSTISKSFPLYLEGTASFSRYDPTFAATGGVEDRRLPAKWNSVSGTAGIGWDFPLVQDIVLRPIFNFSLGHVESDLSIAGRVIGNRLDKDLKFLDNGRLNAAGVGGSLMLDYERYRPEGEIDVELRYTNIYLQSIYETSEAAEGSSDVQNLSLYTRWRAPTGLTALDRPLRYVLEFAHTQFLGDLRGALGFDWLSSLGVGFELDSSAYDVIVTRTRLLGRYQFGEGVHGWSISLAVSF
jgi:hypothetical protein